VIFLEDVETALAYVEEKKYDAAKLFLENVIRAENGV